MDNSSSWYARLPVSRKRTVWAWGFLAIPIVFYCVVRFYPTANAVVLSFQEWNLLGARSWAGLQNYQQLLQDEVFWKVFKNTFVYLLIGTQHRMKSKWRAVSRGTEAGISKWFYLIGIGSSNMNLVWFIRILS